MDQTKKNTIAVLKNLLKICKDEHSLFQAAADNCSDLKLKSSLIQYAKNKDNYASKLKCEIKRLGENPDLPDNTTDKISFMSFNGMNYTQNEVLLQCINTDSITIQKYSSAIKEDILWEVIPLVAKQYFDSINLHDQMINLIKPVQNKSMLVVA